MRTSLVVIASIAAVALVGCSSDGSAHGPSTPIGTATSQTPSAPTTAESSPSADAETASPTSAPAAGFSGGPFHLRDDRDYTFDLTVDLTLTGPEVNTQVDPPGTAAVFAKVGGDVVLTNTTSGHDFPSGAVGYAVVQLWPESSPVCVAYHQDAGMVNHSTPVVTLLSPKGSFCSVVVGVTNTPQTIPTTVSGQSDSQPLVAGPPVAPASANVSSGYPPEDVILDSIPEAQAQAVVEQLTGNPPLYLLVYLRSAQHPPTSTDAPLSAACAGLYRYSFGPVLASSQPIQCAAA